MKEKFKQWLDTNPRVQIRDIQLEIIAEEFAIGFAEWFVLNYTEEIFYEENYTKELLEIYKKTL